MKFGQNCCLDEFSDEFENGSSWLKTRSLGQILETRSIRSRDRIFSLILMKLCENVCLNEISDGVEMHHVGSKTRSLGQIREEHMLVMLYHTIGKFQVSDFRAIMAHLLIHDTGPKISRIGLPVLHKQIINRLSTKAYFLRPSCPRDLYIVTMIECKFVKLWRLNTATLGKSYRKAFCLYCSNCLRICRRQRKYASKLDICR